MSLKKENQGQLILLGIVALASAWFLYDKFNTFETNGGKVSATLILMLIYDFFGKSAASGILLVSGLWMIVNGILNINNQKKWDAIEIEKKKPKFISFSDGEEFEIIRTLSNDEVDYFENMNFEIKEGLLFKHYWTDNSIDNKNDENWFNISTYFWKVDTQVQDALLPENFNNYQQLQFWFLNQVDQTNIKFEKLNNGTEKYYYEKQNEKIAINNLVERNIIEYCEIQSVGDDAINDFKYYQEELFFLITNSKVKCQNNELYINEDKVSIEIAYAIGAIELLRTKKNKVTLNY